MREHKSLQSSHRRLSGGKTVMDARLSPYSLGSDSEPMTQENHKQFGLHPSVPVRRINDDSGGSWRCGSIAKGTR